IRVVKLLILYYVGTVLFGEDVRIHPKKVFGR
ncbi:hypothetical protein LCGC14_3015530, partial [marine sediment metagenome]